MTKEPIAPRFVFIGGLHRSGTSLLTRLIGAHPSVSAFKDTGVPEDEGQHLQSVYPAALAYGGPGRFALSPQAHLTEASSLNTSEAGRKLFEQWSGYWDLSKPVLLEKSPPNLIRMRFLQALFPNSHFLMIVRHPLAVAYATQKWSPDPLRKLVRNWERAHELVKADAPYIQNLRIVRYEDLVERPKATLEEVFGFLELPLIPAAVPIHTDLNSRYLERWRRDRSQLTHWLDSMIVAWRWKRTTETFGYELFRDRHQRHSVN